VNVPSLSWTIDAMSEMRGLVAAPTVSVAASPEPQPTVAADPIEPTTTSETKANPSERAMTFSSRERGP
jgi:hypothetical protein